jgi:hypothetical protein
MRRVSQPAVLSLLNNEDIEGLLASGAPADEYESEAAMIAQAVERLTEDELDLERVTRIVADVCGQMFGPFGDDDLRLRWPGYQRVAKRIIQGGQSGKAERP